MVMSCRRSDGTVAALKTVDEAAAVLDEELADAAFREGRLWRLMAHPAIATLHACWAEAGAWRLVVEIVEGPTLHHVTAQAALGKYDTQQLGVQLVCALIHIHGHEVAHRDVNPLNIIMGPAGAKLVDFGLAKQLGPKEKTMTIVGTPEFMAPEIHMRNDNGIGMVGHNKEVDWWAAGAVLFTAIHGHPPWQRQESDKAAHNDSPSKSPAEVGYSYVEEQLLLSIRKEELLWTAEDRSAKPFIEKLLAKLPKQRCGWKMTQPDVAFSEVLGNDFFEGVDWEQTSVAPGPLKWWKVSQAAKAKAQARNAKKKK